MSARTPWLCLSEAVGLEVNGVRLWLTIDMNPGGATWTWTVTDLSDGKTLSTGTTPKHRFLEVSDSTGCTFREFLTDPRYADARKNA